MFLYFLYPWCVWLCFILVRLDRFVGSVMCGGTGRFNGLVCAWSWRWLVLVFGGSFLLVSLFILGVVVFHSWVFDTAAAFAGLFWWRLFSLVNWFCND